jgi:hypothetical protein
LIKGGSKMIGSEDRAALSAHVGDLAGTVCECVRFAPPGWYDPAYPEREPPAGTRYVRGADGEQVRTLTARDDCRTCGGTGRVQAGDYPGRCACAERLPAGWLLRSKSSSSHRWPDPPAGRVYRVDLASPEAPPRWTAVPNCAGCGGTGKDPIRLPRSATPGQTARAGLVPPGSVADGDLDSEETEDSCSSCGCEIDPGEFRHALSPQSPLIFCGACWEARMLSDESDPEDAGRPAQTEAAGGIAEEPTRDEIDLAVAAAERLFQRQPELRPRGQSPHDPSVPAETPASAVLSAAGDAVRAVQRYPRDVAVRALHVAAQVLDDTPEDRS